MERRPLHNKGLPVLPILTHPILLWHFIFSPSTLEQWIRLIVHCHVLLLVELGHDASIRVPEVSLDDHKDTQSQEQCRQDDKSTQEGKVNGLTRRLINDQCTVSLIVHLVRKVMLAHLILFLARLLIDHLCTDHATDPVLLQLVTECVIKLSPILIRAVLGHILASRLILVPADQALDTWLVEQTEGRVLA